MSVYGFIHGDVRKLLAPIDGNKQFCGIKNGDTANGDLVGYDKLYIGNLLEAAGGASLGDYSGAFASGVCVKTCPKNHGGQIGTACKAGTQLCDNAEA